MSAYAYALVKTSLSRERPENSANIWYFVNVMCLNNLSCACVWNLFSLDCLRLCLRLCENQALLYVKRKQYTARLTLNVIPGERRETIRELKQRRFWATNVNRKFMFLLLARFHARPMSYKALISAYTTGLFEWKGCITHQRGGALTSGWRPCSKTSLLKLPTNRTRTDNASVNSSSAPGH